MIIFAPAYDAATIANNSVAKAMRRRRKDIFIGAAGTNSELKKALRKRKKKPLLAMCHGDVDLILCAPNTPALLQSELRQISPRSVFAHACYTARSIGKTAASLGFIWWGYEFPTTAPTESPLEVLRVFCDIFEFIKTNFPHAKTKARCKKFFRELYELCERAKDKLYEIGCFDQDPQMCIRNIQVDLLVWLPGKGAMTSPLRPKNRPLVWV